MIDFLLRPLRRNFGKDKAFYAAIDDMFGFIPHNIELYKLALIHKSASVVLEDGSHINNERLEFLGDAVLECVSSDYLFIEFPDKNEGFLTQLRSKMVSRQTLNEVAKRIGLDAYVITHSSNNLSQKHIYGDAFEAMMGAIYLDQGYDFVNRLLINRIFVDYIKVGTLLESETDFKSRLIEWCQKNHHTIHFATSHDKTYSTTHPFFYSKVLIDNMEVGYGAGDSKKEAEQRAAHSVSMGFSEADCAKLLDKLDNLDAMRGRKSNQSAKSEQKPQSQPPKQQSQPKQRAVNESIERIEQKSEPKPKAKKEETLEVKPAEQKPAEAKPTEQKPQNNPQRKRFAKPAEQSAPNAEQKPADKVVKTEKVVKADKDSESENITKPEKAVKPLKAEKAEKTEKVEKSVKATPAAESATTQEGDAERKPTVRRAPRRRSGAKKDASVGDKRAQANVDAGASSAPKNEQKELF